MKLSLVSLAMLSSIGLTIAAPSPMPGPPGPPGPPKGTVGQASQSCGNSISLSSLSCCSQSSSGNAGPGPGPGPGKPPGKNQVVQHNGNAFDMQCSAIASDHSKAISNVCSVTVACCYGDGCVAIAE